MRRPNYSAVTGVTVVLAVVCAMRLAFQPLIPPPHANDTGRGVGEFVERAQAQDIKWRPLGAAAFAEAQQRSKPIFLAIGVPWSGLGRRVDEAFMSPEVARALEQGFVPVRVDTAQDPRWISQFLPLQRMRNGLSVGFQGWIFDLKHRLIGFVGTSSAGDTIDATSLLDRLLAAQSAFSDAVLSDDTPPIEADQQADAQRLLQSGVANLSLANAARTMVQGLDPLAGGWRLNGSVQPRPLAFRFLQLTGNWDVTGQALRAILLSSRADWLDGGFYRKSGDAPFPGYDKPVVLNAQFAEALAAQDAARPTPLFRKAAKRTADWILGLGGRDLLPSAEAGDEDEHGRSARASFSPRALSDAVAGGTLTPGDRAWAEGFLRVQEGSRLPVPTLPALADPRLDGVLAALHRSAGPSRPKVGTDLCEPNGAVAACLLRCARIWNDRDLATQAGLLVDRLESFQTPSGIRHSLTASSLPYLGDSLAYADAEMEDFLTNGRVPSLQRGAAELRRALHVFGGPELGLLRPSPVGTTLLPGVAELPQVTDDEREALSAAALRLLDVYALTLGDEGNDLAVKASDLDAQLGMSADAMPAMAGALGALARHTDLRAVFVIGKDAVARANRLAHRLPNRLIVPILGPVHPELRTRSAGLYVAASTGLSGPLSETEVLDRLPLDLEVGL